jgi:hypothetical protein
VREKIALLGCALLLAACGAHPGSPRPIEIAPSALPKPLASPVAPTADGLAEGARLKELMRKLYTTSTGVELEVVAYSEGHYKAGKQVDELRKATYRTKLLWTKPQLMRAQILESDNFLVGGAKMTTTDGKQIGIRGAGFLGIFPVKLAATDDKLANNRNHRFTTMLPDPLIARLLAATWVAQPATDAHSVRVGLQDMKHLDPEIEREDLVLDPPAGLLKRVTMYGKSRALVDYRFSNFRWSPKTTRDMFDL